MAAAIELGQSTLPSSTDVRSRQHRGLLSSWLQCMVLALFSCISLLFSGCSKLTQSASLVVASVTFLCGISNRKERSRERGRELCCCELRYGRKTGLGTIRIRTTGNCKSNQTKQLKCLLPWNEETGSSLSERSWIDGNYTRCLLLTMTYCADRWMTMSWSRFDERRIMRLFIFFSLFEGLCISIDWFLMLGSLLLPLVSIYTWSSFQLLIPACCDVVFVVVVDLTVRSYVFLNTQPGIFLPLRCSGSWAEFVWSFLLLSLRKIIEIIEHGFSFFFDPPHNTTDHEKWIGVK